MSSSATNSPAKTQPVKTKSKLQEPRKVRALYDFEAAEDNELTFSAGEFIYVIDDADQNWWKGYNERGEGLFPSNFVTADLSAEPESTRLEKQQTNIILQEEKPMKKEESVEIDESKIDRLLYLLHEANPEDPTQDQTEMLHLEQIVNQMHPLIDAGLERVDRNHAKLTQLSCSFVEGVNMYHTLMRDADFKAANFRPGMPGQLNGSVGHIGGGSYGPYGVPNSYAAPINTSVPQQMGICF